MAKMTRQERLIARAESFARGCSRNRMELQLVDEIHRLNRVVSDLDTLVNKQNENIYLLIKEGYGNGQLAGDD